MDVTVNIKGMRELEARLQEIGGLGSQKILRRVLRKIARPMLNRARGNAVSLGASGALSRSMAIVSKRPKGQQVAVVAVTSKAKDRTALWLHNTAYRRQRKGIFYGWMVDQGHNTPTGRTRPRPWFTPAVQASENQAISAFTQELAAALRRIERRKSALANPDSVVTE
jgi:hypothetical protein